MCSLAWEWSDVGSRLDVEASRGNRDGELVDTSF